MLFEPIEDKPFLLQYLLMKYRFNYWDRKTIEKYQQECTSNIMKYAKDHSPYFEKKYQGIEDFNKLPIINKSFMMDNFSEYNTLGIKKQDLLDFALKEEKKRTFSKKFHGITIGMSSGTSGNKGLVITTPKELHYLKALFAARLVFPKKIPIRAAFILRVNSPAFYYRRSWFSLYYVDQLQMIEQIVAELNTVDPDMLASSPSMLELLADQKKKGLLHINPSVIYSYAEVLEPQVKSSLQDAFDVDIHQIYQGSEGTYAMTCSKGSLHINEDFVYFELLKTNSDDASEKTPSYRTLVTDLHKRSQPIIRYELNDVITLSPKPCPCGSSFQVIESIQGRADDLIWGIREDNKKPHFIYQDFIRRAIITASDDIIDYQVFQHTMDSLKINLVFHKEKSIDFVLENITNNIYSVYQKYKCHPPKIIYNQKRPKLHPTSGKLIRIQSFVNPYE